ncbi:hypothetical protein [Streptomyces sp. NPDC093094]|uniref:hypothetical protein n=1 Tax=Streptomyces sp. NPDC093094 TaxID=3366026 RepID=UPI0038215B79
MTHRQSRGRTGVFTSPAHRMRVGAGAAGLALAFLATACGSGRPDTSDKGTPAISSAPVAGVVAPAKVEVIAELTGCKVKIRTDADELREGVCHTEAGDYLITTFPEEKYQRIWLDTLSMYQGTYLVGSRWVVSAQPAMLKAFRPELGGEIVHLSGTGPSAGPSQALPRPPS